MEIAQLLLQAGASVHATELENSETKMARLLLDAHAPVHVINHPESGSQVLIFAIEAHDVKLTQGLLHLGAKVNNNPGCYPRTPIQAAGQVGSLELVRILIDAGADVHAPPCHGAGVTALQAAAAGGYTGIAARLLEAGADVNEPPSVSGRTALEEAAKNGRIDMAQLLLNAGIDLGEERRMWYYAPIALAREFSHFAIMELLEKQLDMKIAEILIE